MKYFLTTLSILFQISSTFCADDSLLSLYKNIIPEDYGRRYDYYTKDSIRVIPVFSETINIDVPKSIYLFNKNKVIIGNFVKTQMDKNLFDPFFKEKEHDSLVKIIYRFDPPFRCHDCIGYALKPFPIDILNYSIYLEKEVLDLKRLKALFEKNNINIMKYKGAKETASKFVKSNDTIFYYNTSNMEWTGEETVGNCHFIFFRVHPNDNISIILEDKKGKYGDYIDGAQLLDFDNNLIPEIILTLGAGLSAKECIYEIRNKELIKIIDFKYHSEGEESMFPVEEISKRILNKN